MGRLRPRVQGELLHLTMLKPALLFAFVAVSAPFAACGQQISETNLQAHISFLASDELKGRGTGSEGEAVAAAYIEKSFRNYKLAPPGGTYQKPFTFKKNLDPHDTATASVPERRGRNVAGFLDNGAPYTIVIGAHFDHLGEGHDRNSLDANPDGKVHNGADDNASGTAGVLELARFFAKNGKTEPFNFMFICFSGEELGLIGSKKWCESADANLSAVAYMINMDMIGRLNDSTRKLIVYGVGTSPTFVPIIDSLGGKFSVKKDSSGVGPSDQTSFYLKDVPVLHFFTGQHGDYHRPTDDAEKVNYRGEREVLEYIVAFIERSYRYGKPAFQKTRTPDTGKVSFKVTMGVMPDYAYEGRGMRVDGVTDGRPASKAGIIRGDVVVKLGDTEVKDVQTYMKALSTYKKGDTAPVEVLRNGDVVKLKVTF